MNSVRQVVNSFRCSGCGACAGVCPKRVISMLHNAAGFLVAVVEQDVCIECGACMKVCPRNAADAACASGSVYCQTAVVERALEHADCRLAVVAQGCQVQAISTLAEAGKFSSAG